jgi:hypothetical protein
MLRVGCKISYLSVLDIALPLWNLVFENCYHG